MTLDGRELINFGSNDYLGLAADPRLADAVAAAVPQEGWGSGASPLISGYASLHARLEQRLAEMEGAEAALLFPSGFAANMGTIAALSINPGLYAKLPFDPEKDLLPVIQAVDSTNVLSLHPSVAAGSVKELIALAKTKSLSYGSSGIGGTGHLAGELFNVMAGTKLVHVPYKGGGPAIIDLVAGQVQVVFATGASAVPQMKTGRIKGIAVTTLKRSALLPDIPTIAEAGLKDFDANNWYGIMVPAKTPRNVINRLNAETTKVLAMPEVKTFLFNQGLDAAPGTPEAFGAYIKAERIKWAKVIKAAGAKAE